MSYPSDGRNHRNAIEAEKSMPLYKPEFEIFFGKKVKEIIHVGGTSTKVDYKITFEDDSYEKRSLKKKDSLDKGSFDYANISAASFHLHLSRSHEIYEKYKGNGENEINKNELLKAIDDDLQNLDSDILTLMILYKICDKYNTGAIDGIDILDLSTNQIYLGLMPKFIDVVLSGGYFQVKKKKREKPQMSYELILFDNQGKEQKNTGLRIRLHLNNGWTKWYNGKNSYLSLKFQQDKVKKFLIENEI